MASANCVFLLLLFSFVSASSNIFPRVQENGGTERGEVGLESLRIGRRALMGFKETPNGGNVTFDCSPSGPCVPCAYAEKSDEKYRCSETGYRIPLKCVETESDSKEANGKKTQNDRSTLESTDAEVKPYMNLQPSEHLNFTITGRNLLDESSTQAYITYRSCIPAVNEERLSVFGFEGTMICLLLTSGSAIYIRRKRSNAVQGGAVRIPNSSRF